MYLTRRSSAEAAGRVEHGRRLQQVRIFAAEIGILLSEERKMEGEVGVRQHPRIDRHLRLLLLMMMVMVNVVRLIVVVRMVLLLFEHLFVRRVARTDRVSPYCEVTITATCLKYYTLL